MSSKLTRRALLAGGLPRVAPGADREILARVLTVESLLVWSYERVLATAALDTSARALAAGILVDERRHVEVLVELTGIAAPTQISLSSAEAELTRGHVGANPTRLSTQHDCLRLLVDVESLAEGAWFSAIGKLGDPVLSGLGAAVMACEAQHWTVLSALAHDANVKMSVPYPFVRGSSGY